MDPEDARSIYEELRELLGENGFGWVVENLDVELDRGVQDVQELPRFQEFPPGEQPARRRRERRERVIATRPHTDLERLSLILDEIDRCLIIPLRIANDLPKTLSPSDTPLTGVEVIDNQTGEAVFRAVWTQAVARNQTATLETAITQIRGRLNAT